MTTKIELKDEAVAALNAYLAHPAETRKSFDQLALDRSAAISAIVGACKDGGKVTVSKATLTAWLKAKGALELRPALVKRLWPDETAKVTLPKKAMAKVSAVAGDIAGVVEAVTNSPEERKAFFRELLKAVESILGSEE